MKSALVRFLLGDTPGHSADGRRIGVGLATALSEQRFADQAEHYVTQWAAERDVHKSTRD